MWNCVELNDNPYSTVPVICKHDLKFLLKLLDVTNHQKTQEKKFFWRQFEILKGTEFWRNFCSRCLSKLNCFKKYFWWSITCKRFREKVQTDPFFPNNYFRCFFRISCLWIRFRSNYFLKCLRIMRCLITQTSFFNLSVRKKTACWLN